MFFFLVSLFQKPNHQQVAAANLFERNGSDYSFEAALCYFKMEVMSDEKQKLNFNESEPMSMDGIYLSSDYESEPQGSFLSRYLTGNNSDSYYAINQIVSIKND